MSQPTIAQHLTARRRLFFNFRWLLFVWLGAVAAWRSLNDLPQEPALYAVMGALLASQAGLRLIPAVRFEGMRIFYAILLLDLLFTLLGVWSAGQLSEDLVTALFLGTFIAALSQKVGIAALGSLVLSAIYLTLKSRSAEGLDLGQTEQLLALPFLLITSLHSGLVAQEASRETQALRDLSKDRNALAAQLNGTFADVARYSREISLLLDAMPFGMIMLDQHGKVRFFNEMAEFVFGLRREQVARQPLASSAELGSLVALLNADPGVENLDFQLLEITNAEGPLSVSVSTTPVQGMENGASGTLVMLFPIAYFETLCRQVHRHEAKMIAA